MHPNRSTFMHASAMFAVLALAVALRIFDFPSRQIVRDMDETGYLTGCLQLIEGITPGYKAAPAGPLFWIGWAQCGGEWIWNMAHPAAAEKQLSPQVRPFAALNRVLFENYRDLGGLHRTLVVANLVIALAGIVAAVILGFRFGGVIAGVLVGGLVACTPVFLQLSEMSRPYSMAWAFGIISLCFASDNNPAKPRRRWMISAVFLGLSIGSRIEMLCVLPLLWWIFLERKPRGSVITCVVKVTAVSLLTASWVAPWLMTHLIGNLRTIATVRFAGPPGGTGGPLAAFKELTINQGMGAAICLALIAAMLQPRGVRLTRGVLCAYLLLMLWTMGSGFAYGIHQHGEVFITLFLLLAVVTGPALKSWPRTIGTFAAASLMIPLGMSIVSIRSDINHEIHEQAVAWIEQHVPAKTTVYVLEGGLRTLLPTPESSDRLWAEVNDNQAWQKKMESGLSRFNVSAQELPRALSEENLIQERGNRRKWFMLGSTTNSEARRYDVHVVMSSPVFGVRNLNAALKEKPGVVLWRDGFDLPLPSQGAPLKEWTSQSGDTVKIFCSPEIKATIDFSGN